MNPPDHLDQTSPAPNSTRWNPWPISIIAFFTVAIIGCGAFVVFCHAHSVDLVASDYYEQELRYQAQLERMQNANHLSATLVSYDPARKTIVVCLPANSSGAVSGNIQLYRPSKASLDRNLTLAPNAAGIQTIDASTLQPGLWKVRVSWTAAKQKYFVEQKIVIGT